ncbi:pyridoxal-phosphate dependent enzyme [Ekhidna sp. MALMAid0563]|uniref:threonine ammonia-lyase n=1 Tax=Ekhidna sp. MALMAid0563 TaxID=3143937 RepID=UPI0032E027D9
MLTSPPSFSDIKRAHQRISKYIYNTPVMTSANLDELAGCHMFFKCENFQKIGAFKMRGATNAIFSFRPEERTNGFACHSSGNHGQAVALAAKLAGSKAYVVMPKDAPKVKVEAVKGYGGEVILCEPTEASRESTCNEVIERTGAILIHPFNDYNIIAGQATASKELIEEVENLDALIAPVGGGGLASGMSLVAHYLDPNLELYVGEPEKVDDCYQSLKKGKLISNKTSNTIADGLKASIGPKTFDILKEYINDVLLVSEQEIIHAMKLIWERMKIVIEPSCAVPFAAILKNPKIFEGKRVGVILTGGNVDLTKLPF